MLDLKQFFYNPTCIRCGSFFVQAHLYCDFCFEHFMQKKLVLNSRQIINENQVTHHFYAIDWTRGESDTLSRMVYALKSDHCVKAVTYYAECILEKFYFCIQNEKYDAIVPLPGSKKSSVHAKILANVLSRHLSLPLRDVLVKSETVTAQKNQTKLQRQQNLSVQMRNPENEQFTIAQEGPKKHLYVDDILTTGMTYIRSRQALQDQQSSGLITLFYRPLISQTELVVKQGF